MAESSNPTVPGGGNIGTFNQFTGLSLWQLGVAVGKYPSGSELGVVVGTRDVSLGALTEVTNSLGLAKTNVSMSSFFMSASCDTKLTSSATHLNPSSSLVAVILFTIANLLSSLYQAK